MYPSIYYLINVGLNSMRFETREIQNFQTVLIKSLKSKKRFHFAFENDLFRAATFLNYKYKKFEFIEVILNLNLSK